MKIPRLELPSGNGNYVEFSDPDELRGKDYRRLRGYWTGAGIVGHVMNDMLGAAAELLVVAWQVDYLGQPLLPRTSPVVLGELMWNDLKAIDEHLMPFVRTYVLQDLEKPDTDGDPQPPASA